MRNWYENIIKFPALKDKRSETANRFRRIEAVADEPQPLNWKTLQ